MGKVLFLGVMRLDTERVFFRNSIQPSDSGLIREIAESTGFFYPDEVEIAVELIDEALQKGEKAGYYFLFAEIEGKTVGYSCYGEIPCTEGSYDLYWIVTHNDFRGKGLGKAMLAATEREIKKKKGRGIYIETSSRDLYKPTQKFYLSCGYKLKAVFEDFYHPGDDKQVYIKTII